MGANPTQAFGILILLAAFVILAAGMAMGGGLALILLSIAVLGVSFAVFRKARPWESKED